MDRGGIHNTLYKCMKFSNKNFKPFEVLMGFENVVLDLKKKSYPTRVKW